jgi:signal transduction histidine kinase
MFVLAGGLFALIVLLATLQYRWLGQISQAERDRMGATLRGNASAFAEDFDRELNRAYLLFQLAPVSADSESAAQVATRADRWQATSRFPRLIKDIYIATPRASGVALQRFNPSTRFVEPSEWPAALEPIRAQIATAHAPSVPAGPDNTIIRDTVPTVWADAPALVVSAPLVFINRVSAGPPDLKLPSQPSYCVLLLDYRYIRTEMLPALAQQHFQRANGGVDYELAVVATAGRGTIYHSVASFDPASDAKVDASADFFNLRLQDFGPLAAEISRFALLSTLTSVPPGHQRTAETTETVIRHTITTPVEENIALPGSGAMSIVVQQKGRNGVTAAVSDRLFTAGPASAHARFAITGSPHWRLLVKHPSGSLEEAVNLARRRNLAVSTAILGVLAISVGFLVVSTRRAHELARQQIEFVATVSHELRTPLAVIRSAADNLADGVVGDEARVRQYGQLVRSEGVRLTGLVEQILEFAGLQSGQRAVSRLPVTIETLLGEAVAAARPAAAAAGVRIDLTIADGLPAVAGDEPALRRAFLNLIGNAVKYGAAAGWVGVAARPAGSAVEIVVSDRGIGIEPADHDRIFEPFYRAADVVAAQIQGAGLGLSLVKRIVQAHGGRIRVASAPGEGSTFTVTLPALNGDAVNQSSGVGAAAPQHL